MMDFSTLPVIDAHCHPFLGKGMVTLEKFVRSLSLACASEDAYTKADVSEGSFVIEIQSHRLNSVYFRWLVRQMAAFFDCKPELEQVVEARNQAARDYRDYVTRLYKECGLEALVVDFGYPQPPIDIAEFNNDIPVTVVPIYRIEPLIDDLLTVSYTHLTLPTKA